MAFEGYLERVQDAIARLAREQAAPLRSAAATVARAIQSGGVLHVFGAGHSHLVAEEAFFRAGGLAAVNPILDRRFMFFDGVMKSMQAEREPGYAEQMLGREDVQTIDAALVVSNSGRNAVPIEMALAFQARGVTVIGATSVAHAGSVPSRHPSGRKLHEIADIVIDTGIPAGDAAVVLPGTTLRMGPLSTIVGAAVVHAIAIEAAALLLADGHQPPVLASANLDTTSEDDLARVLAKYADRIRYLDVT